MKRKSISIHLKRATLHLSFIFIFLIPFYLPQENRVRRNAELNVLLITLDTTRADRLGCYGYQRAKTPNLDALASSGILFQNAYSSVPLTLPSHCSLLTGTYPLYHNVHNNGFYILDEENITLAEVLREKGFETAAFVSSFTVDSRFGLSQGFNHYDDRFDAEEALKNFRSERRAEDTYASFLRWLEGNYQKKFLCWIHFFDPHLPYDPPSPFKEEFKGKPYDGEIAYMDFYLGKTVESLREKGILEKTLLVLAGDHGEALGEKRELDHGLFVYENTIKVPLIIVCKNYLPQGLVLTQRVRLIDIMPTILDLLDLEKRKECQGQSLIPLIEGKKREDLPVYFETYFPRENYGWSELVGLLEGEWKLIEAPKPELYNLRKDPQEEENLFPKQKRIVQKLKEKLTETIRYYGSSLSHRKKILTEEEERKLRSLGYLAGERLERKGERILPDPKDKIDEYVLYFRGNLHETRGEYEEAEKCYREVLRLNPEAPTNYVNLGFLYMKMERIEEAIKTLEEGKKRHSRSLLILSRLIGFYLRAGRLEEAREACLETLKLEPGYFDALFLAGSISAKKGDFNQALSFYEKASEIEPENKVLKMRRAFTLAALKRYDEAIKIYQELKDEYPHDLRILKELCALYEEMGNVSLALETLSPALKHNPEPELYYDYSLLLEKAGNLKQAINFVKIYIEKSKDQKNGRRKEAERKLKEWERKVK